MSRAVLVFALCLSMSVSSPTPVAASPGCSGCDLVAERNFGTWLIGTTVYEDRLSEANIPYTVLAVDLRRREVKVRARDGRQGWVSAYNLYSPVAARERDSNTRAGVAAGVVVGLAALLFGGSDKPRQNTNRGSYDYNAQAEHNRCVSQCSKIYDPDPNREAAVIQNCRRRC